MFDHRPSLMGDFQGANYATTTKTEVAMNGRQCKLNGYYTTTSHKENIHYE